MNQPWTEQVCAEAIADCARVARQYEGLAILVQVVMIGIGIALLWRRMK